MMDAHCSRIGENKQHDRLCFLTRTRTTVTRTAMSAVGAPLARLPAARGAIPGRVSRSRATPRPASRRASPRGAVAMAVAPSTASTVLALDFDGVVCDSEPESSISGWKHAVALWPEVFDDETQYARVLEGLKRTRPVVETGFENTLLARCILEKTHSADAIVNDWGALMPELMERWQLDRAEMVRGYGAIRDDWMAADLDGWLAPNLIYPGVGEAVRLAESSRHADVFVVTTKQARFASAIMSQKANLEIPPERLFSQTVSGVPKTEVLLALQADAAPGARLVFVEDKMSTLEKVCARDGLETWELFLVDWGYNTEEERARARANPRIRVVDLETFAETLGEAAKGGG
jgi:hypothetical protein